MPFYILASGIRTTRIAECKPGQDPARVTMNNEYFIDIAETLEEAERKLAEHIRKDGVARFKRAVGFIYRWIFMIGLSLGLYFYSDIGSTVNTPLGALTISRIVGTLTSVVLITLLCLWAFQQGHKNYELWFFLGNGALCLTLLAWYYFIYR